jgi:hypothetical protein
VTINVAPRLTWLAIVLSSPLASGCAYQATSGVIWTGRREAAPVLTTGSTTQSYRTDGGVVGVRVSSAFEHAVVPRHAIVHGGYDWHLVPGAIELEPGLDLGLGGPIVKVYSGVGAYVGLSPTLRFFLLGVNDDEPAFNILAPSLELVVTGRGGGWMPPEGATSSTLVGEFGAEIGLRFAIGSDLAADAAGKVHAPRNSKNPGEQR